MAEKNDFWDYIEGMQCFLSDRYLFVITATGKEELYQKKEDKFELTQSLEGKRFAERIKREFNTGFPDFWTVRYRRI